VQSNKFTSAEERAMLEESHQLVADFKAGKVKDYSSAQEMLDDLDALTIPSSSAVPSTLNENTYNIRKEEKRS
jgi:hypothetical protein